MKVNFWQAVGAVLIILGVVFVVRREMSTDDTVTPKTNTPAATVPATQPAP